MTSTTRTRSSLTGSRLRDKFIFFFAIASCAPILLLGGVVLALVTASHERDVSRLELQLIAQKTEEIQRFFARILPMLDIHLDVREDDITIEWQERIADEILANPAITEISFIDLQGNEVLKKMKDGESGELLQLSELKKFKVALDGRTYIGNAYQTIRGPALSVASPVVFEGRVVRIISAELDIREVYDSVRNATLGHTGYLILADQNGTVIANGAANGREGIGIATYERFKRISEAHATLDGMSDDDRYASPFSGVPVVGAGASVPELGWTILSEWPMSDADLLISDIRNRVLLIIFLSVIAVCILVPFIASRLLKPIRTLEVATREIEDGNFETSVAIKTNDELEELGGAFNHMASGLKRLQELKNEFVFVAAHELRSPVTAIKGYLSLIEEGDAGAVSAELKRFLDPVQQCNDRLIRLVNDLLEIARSDAGKLTIDIEECAVADSVRAILAEIKPLADQKRIAITYTPHEPDMRVMGDPSRIKEVIMNFVSNAIKYNNTGGWVKIYHETSGDLLLTHIEDNGFGMSEEDQAHMFEKFFRSASGQIKGIQGTGLGLFITKELVEKMGGAVSLRSRVGVGTRFSFSLKQVPMK